MAMASSVFVGSSIGTAKNICWFSNTCFQLPLRKLDLIRFYITCVIAQYRIIIKIGFTPFCTVTTSAVVVVPGFIKSTKRTSFCSQKTTHDLPCHLNLFAFGEVEWCQHLDFCFDLFGLKWFITHLDMWKKYILFHSVQKCTCRCYYFNSQHFQVPPFPQFMMCNNLILCANRFVPVQMPL